MATWRPAHVAGSCLGCLISNPGGHPNKDAVYTFGHPGSKPGLSKSSAEDRAAATWWAPGMRPSTNDAANADVEAFWSRARAADAAGAVRDLTGRETAVAVKTAGRGSHVTLGFEGNTFTRSSKYVDDFCVGGAAGAAGTEQGPAAQYAAAKKAARANRALGTGASLSLSQMW
ncbi:hypothetical protein Rsub_01182 [Raphidocelis subcapitata]|uniref:Uncharacterized protein n=1 Tax=Raphidocelis subcapitata TaxID=307507 RepID=A0A2V0NMT7_9CHLO|nr:hypothetical protein Rsub_01182 [Raphidocelis subcapitata]|eukprot:GBF88469.1 hypothetical protein Rsub_01182 [Raphidocelis subcapitata]